MEFYFCMKLVLNYSHQNNASSKTITAVTYLIRIRNDPYFIKMNINLKRYYNDCFSLLLILLVQDI